MGRNISSPVRSARPTSSPQPCALKASWQRVAI